MQIMFLRKEKVSIIIILREVSSLQDFKHMQELFLEKEKVSLLERCPHFRGVLIGEVSSFQGCPEREVPLYFT